jgi:hypothetical protein
MSYIPQAVIDSTTAAIAGLRILLPTDAEYDTVQNAILNTMTDEHKEALGEGRARQEALVAMNILIQRQLASRLENYVNDVTHQLLAFIGRVAEEGESHLVNNNTFRPWSLNVTNLTNSNNQMHADMQRLNTQVSAIPMSAQAGGSRQPKMSEPPEFNGSSKVTFKEWKNKIDLWIIHENIQTDRMKITLALGKLVGPAALYMSPWMDRVKRANGIQIGDWDRFLLDMRAPYGQKDEKEGARQELTALFTNKTLAHSDFLKYAERFRTLARISEYASDLLIDKLDHIIDQPMRQTLIGYKTARMAANLQVTTDWSEYLDVLLDLYKQLHPEKSKGYVFDSGKKGSTSQGEPMDIDSAEKSKKKESRWKKNKKDSKETNSAEVDKSKKHCHICKTHGNHTTDECYSNRKTHKETPDEKKKRESKNKDEKKSKKKEIRTASVHSDSDDDSSDDAKTPSSSKQANSAQLKQTAFIEEVDSSDDETPAPPPIQDKGKGKMKQSGKDFLRRTL